MGFFSKFFKSRDKPKNYLGGLSFLFGSTTAGQTVNESTSMQVTAVYARARISANCITEKVFILTFFDLDFLRLSAFVVPVIVLDMRPPEEYILRKA